MESEVSFIFAILFGFIQSSKYQKSLYSTFHTLKTTKKYQIYVKKNAFWKIKQIKLCARWFKTFLKIESFRDIKKIIKKTFNKQNLLQTHDEYLSTIKKTLLDISRLWQTKRVKTRIIRKYLFVLYITEIITIAHLNRG